MFEKHWTLLSVVTINRATQ